jgi:spermidine synthase
LLTGLSSAVLGHLSSWRPHALLTLGLLLGPAAFLASLLLQQTTLPAFTTVGLLLGPGRTLLATTVCLFPPCLLLGGAFAVTSRLAAPGASVAGWAARIYTLESLGTVAAGLLFHFGLAHMSLRAAALVAGSLLWLAALPLSLALRGGWRRVMALPALVGAICLLLLIPGLHLPGARLLERRVPGYQILEQKNSPHGALAVLRRGDQTLFTANSQTLFTTQDEERVETEIHLSLLAHPAPRRLLMVSGGLGGGLEEALKHPVDRIDYVELDPLLVDLVRRHGGPRLSAPLADRRIQVLIGDGRQIVAQRDHLYDVILVGLPGPSSALVNRFYTEEFFRSARHALRPGGLVRVALEGSEGYVSDEVALAHAAVLSAMRRELGSVSFLPGQTTLFFGGTDDAPDFRPATLVRRFRERRLATQFFSETEIMDRALPFKQEVYGERIEKVPPPRNTDLHPAAYFHLSLLWLAASTPQAARVLRRIGESASPHLWIAPGVALALGLLGGAARRKRPAAGFAIFVAGFAGLALEVTVLLASQEFRGVVYHEIGALLVAFMLGLAGGAPTGHRLVRRWPRSALRLSVVAVSISSGLIFATLHVTLRFPSTALWMFLGGLLLVGLAVGICYPPAVAALATPLGESAASRVYAWDVFGAAVGAFLATGIVIPVLGLTTTCAVCGALALGCAVTVRRSTA